MQDAGYEIKPGKYISFRAEGQERFTRAKTIGDNYTEDRIKKRIQGRGNCKRQMQTSRRGISLISDIQERIQLIGSKGYEHKASSPFSKKLRGRSTISPKTIFCNMPILRRRPRTFTAPMLEPAMS